MRFENRFAVDAPLEEVWNALLDVERVAPTVPGAQVLEQTGDDAYNVAIKVKVGPMSMTYKGEVEIVERDEAAHRAVMKARAKESRGQGTADADVTMTLSGEDGRTEATVRTEVQLSGKVATMGQGVLQDVSGRLVQAFAQNLAAMLEGGEAAAPAPEPVAASSPGASTAAGAPGAAGFAALADTSGSGPREQAPPRRPAPEPADALDLGSVGGAVIAERLRDPRVIGALLAAAALVLLALRRRA